MIVCSVCMKVFVFVVIVLLMVFIVEVGSVIGVFDVDIVVVVFMMIGIEWMMFDVKLFCMIMIL